MEKMRDPNYRPGEASEIRPPGAEEAERDITRDNTAFTAAIRNRIFTFLRGLLNADYDLALGVLDGADKTNRTYEDSSCSADVQWAPNRLREAMDAYHVGHRFLRLDPEARNLRHTYVTPSDDKRTWTVQQMLVDPDELNDWVAEFAVDLAQSREANEPVMRLVKLGSLTG